MSINEEDMHGFIEVVQDMQGGSLDLILHSPGGSAEVAESIVSYLRKFDHIRAIVPHAAMSAATMLACSADQILMGAHSSLGPIDPQLVLDGQYGAHMQPAQAIIDNFEKARQVSKTSPDELGAYIPILTQYHPGLIEQCRRAQDLSRDLVSSWLEQYMHKGKYDAKALANKAADALANHGHFKSHSRHIDNCMAKDLGLAVAPLEDDPLLHDLVLSVFHATTITFQQGPTKIIENNTGKTFIKQPLVPPFQAPPRDAGPS